MNTGTLVSIVAALTGLASVRLFSQMFFSVKANERGVWFRLGKVVYFMGEPDQPKLLRPGRPGVRFPFTWKLEKISIALKTCRTEDMELERALNGQTKTQKWIIRCELIFKVIDDPGAIVRAAIRAVDRDETAVAIIVGALSAVLERGAVDELTERAEILERACEECAEALREIGIEWVGLNFIKFARSDAQIMADAIAVSTVSTSGHGSNGNGHGSAEIARSLISTTAVDK
jgi:regulator of protease activity HflC (stomatin/prohibitin superfamily)